MASPPPQTVNTGSTDTGLDIAHNVITGSVRLGHNVTTGDIDIGGDITTGELKIGWSQDRTADLIIGHGSASGDLEFRSGSGTLNIGTLSSGACNIMSNSPNANTIKIGTHGRTGDVTIQTGGDLFLGTQADDVTIGSTAKDIFIGQDCDDVFIGNRCDDLFIGNQCDDIFIGGEEVGSRTFLRGELVTIGDTTTASDITLGSDTLTGNVNVGGTSSTTNLNGKIVLGTKGTVTQTTSPSTFVTLNATSGVITTATLTNGNHEVVSFTWNNTFITTSSVINIQAHDYTANDGIVHVDVHTLAAGSCTVRISNVSLTALAGTAKLHFTVL